MINNNNKKKTLVYALGGLEEIGKNTYCIEYDNEVIIIDAGIKFPDAELLGVNAIIPDYTYLKENNKKISCILITHGHEDHIGGIPYLLSEIKNIPFIYSPKIATALIRDTLKTKKITTSTSIKEYNSETKIKTKNFLIEFFAVNHSIPDAFGISITTPNGIIVTTGDYKFDWTPLGHDTDLKKMSEIGNKGVKLLMADSTNAEKDGYTLTEKDVINNIEEIIKISKDRVFVTCFASNVHRIQKIVEIADKYERKILILGRSLERIIKIIREIGHLKISNKSFITGSDEEKIKICKKNKNILIICTGSQGEQFAALPKISNREHKIISVKTGDTIIFSASPIPGNKKPVEDLVNKLTKEGAIVKENSSTFPLHTSGHASKEEQKLLFKLIKPKYFMPMHGDYRMLKEHSETAAKVNIPLENSFICSNGDQINILNDKAWIDNRIHADDIYIDGNDISGLTTSVIRDRKLLSKNGLVAVIFAIDTVKNVLISPPRIISRGSFYVRDSNKLMFAINNLATEVINDVLKQTKPTFSQIKNEIKSKLSPFIFKYKRRNPIIIPVILNTKTPTK